MFVFYLFASKEGRRAKGKKTRNAADKSKVGCWCKVSINLFIYYSAPPRYRRFDRIGIEYKKHRIQKMYTARGCEQ